ncbi:MAG: hypothetical protein HY458_02750 [Parcubacteria group bacterium]|nr:hypothetical protein [Parcubacteria group bacterium]
MKRKYRRQRGVTMLLALLVISVALTVSLGVSNLVLGELLLSTSGRDSQIAFYSADTAVECALYWELVEQAFDQGTSIRCADREIVPVIVGDGTRWEFSLELPLEESVTARACADVSLEKDPVNGNVTVRGLGNFPAVLENERCVARGRTVQRGIETRFSF